VRSSTIFSTHALKWLLAFSMVRSARVTWDCVRIRARRVSSPRGPLVVGFTGLIG